MSEDSKSALESEIQKKASALAASYLESLVSSTGRMIDRKITARYFSFQGYIEKTYKKCKYVKIITEADSLCPIDSVYVNTYFKCGESLYKDTQIQSMVKDNERVVVIGLGGVGKTIFLKKFWLDMISAGSTKIPIFLELKRLNELSKLDLKTYIRHLISPAGQLASEAVFDEMISAGRLIFLFDGSDEIADKLKDDVEKQIQSLSYNSPKCGFIISGRLDDRFVSWDGYLVCKAMPFGKEQVIQLVNNVRYNTEVKKKFLDTIVLSKFEKHSDFLSNPLLALIMLITFSQFGDVPEKLHIFYRYAFSTLYSLHDAAKESFKRERKSGLSEDDFLKIFSFFSLITYADEKYYFDKDALQLYIEEAVDKSEVTVDIKKLIHEIVESVNLLYKEGDIYSFTHRSFQEYFTAYAIANFFHSHVEELIYELPQRVGDTMLSMLYQIAQTMIIENFLKPQHKKHVAELGRIAGIRDSSELYAETNSSFLMIGVYTKSKATVSCFSSLGNEATIFMRIALQMLSEQEHVPQGHINRRSVKSIRFMIDEIRDSGFIIPTRGNFVLSKRDSEKDVFFYTEEIKDAISIKDTAFMEDPRYGVAGLVNETGLAYIKSFRKAYSILQKSIKSADGGIKKRINIIDRISQSRRLSRAASNEETD